MCDEAKLRGKGDFLFIPDYSGWILPKGRILIFNI